MQSEKINFMIKSGWVAGLIYFFVNLTLTIIYSSGGSVADVVWYNWLDLLIIAVLSIGVYRRSRLSAVLLLVYFAGTNLISLLQFNQIISLPAMLILGFFLFQGVRGTFAHHNARPLQPQTT